MWRGRVHELVVVVGAALAACLDAACFGCVQSWCVGAFVEQLLDCSVALVNTLAKRIVFGVEPLDGGLECSQACFDGEWLAFRRHRWCAGSVDRKRSIRLNGQPVDSSWLAAR